MSYNNDYTYRIMWRDDSVLKPAETHVIVNNRIILGEIPDANYRVFVTGYTELYGDFTTPLDATTFRVDYTTGLVNFDSNQEGVEVTVSSYYGRGIIYFPYSRIWTEADNEEVLETLKDVVDSASEVTDVVSSVQVFEPYNPLTNYEINNKAFYDGSTYYCIQDSTGNQPDISPTYWSMMAQKGDQGIQGEKGMQWQGTYSGATTYIVDDAVEYEGSSYINILDSTGIVPTNPTYWSLLAQQGDAGVGLVYQGDYDAGKAYVEDDAVRYNNDIYYCILANTGQQPDISPTYWILFMQGNTSALATTGGTMTGDLKLSDDVNLQLGTTVNANIKYDSVNTINKIELLNNVELDIQNLSEPIADFIPNSSVNLYYDGNKKFETTNIGVTITGDATTSGGNTIDTNASDISTLQTDIGTLQTNVSDLDTNKMDNPTNNGTATNGQVLVSNGDGTSTFSSAFSNTYIVATGKSVDAQSVVSIDGNGVGNYGKAISALYDGSVSTSATISASTGYRTVAVGERVTFNTYLNSEGLKYTMITPDSTATFYDSGIDVHSDNTNYYDACKLTNGRAIVVYRDETTDYLSCFILEKAINDVVTGRPIMSSIYDIVAVNDTYSNIKVNQITINKILLTYSASSNTYARIVKVNDDGVTVGNSIILNDTVDTEIISESQAVACSIGGASMSVYLLDVSGMDVVEVSTTTHTPFGTANLGTLVKYDKNKVMLVYEVVTTLYGSVITIDGSTITSEAYQTLLTGRNFLNIKGKGIGNGFAYLAYVHNTDDLYLATLSVDDLGVGTVTENTATSTSTSSNDFDFDFAYYDEPIVGFESSTSYYVRYHWMRNTNAVYNNSSKGIIGIAKESGIAGESVVVSYEKEVDGFTNLTVGEEYYVQPGGEIGINNYIRNAQPIGVAISSTTLRMYI